MSEQKVALITGGARGIARAITLDLASRGWSVAICYRTSARQATEVIDTVEREGAKGLAFQADVSNPEAATGLVRQVHQEWGRIDAATAERLNAVRAVGGRLIAVGTTSLRLIESASDEDGIIRPFEGDTAIFITPGYRFRAVDGLVTNFHLPRSTLFMLVSALMGLDVMKSAYAHAIANGYRFYSYGDASLLLPQPRPI